MWKTSISWPGKGLTQAWQNCSPKSYWYNKVKLFILLHVFSKLILINNVWIIYFIFFTIYRIPNTKRKPSKIIYLECKGYRMLPTPTWSFMYVLLHYYMKFVNNTTYDYNSPSQLFKKVCEFPWLWIVDEKGWKQACKKNIILHGQDLCQYLFLPEKRPTLQ